MNKQDIVKLNCMNFLKFFMLIFLFFMVPEIALAGELKVCTEDQLGNTLSGSGITLRYTPTNETWSNYFYTGVSGCGSTFDFLNGTYTDWEMFACHSPETESGYGNTITRSYVCSAIINPISIPQTYNLTVGVRLASLTINATSCNTGDPITNGFSFHYGGSTITDANNDGTMSFISKTGADNFDYGGVYPGIYNGSYISADGYANSDSQVIALSSGQGRTVDFCCNEHWGSLDIHVEDTGGSPIAGAYLIIEGTEYPEVKTNSSGNLIFNEVASGTYNNVTVAVESGDLVAAESPRTIEVKDNQTTEETFIMKSSVDSFTYNWSSPVEGSSVVQNGNVEFDVSLYFPDPVSTTDNLCIKGCISTICSQECKPLSYGKDFNYNFDVPANLSPGTYLATLWWSYQGKEYRLSNVDRNITVISSADTNKVSGKVEVCNTDPYYNFFTEVLGFSMLPGASVNNISTASSIAMTNIFGLYSAYLPKGNYNLNASKENYQNSVTKNVDLTAGDANVDFCLSTRTGSLHGYVRDISDNPLDSVEIYIMKEDNSGYAYYGNTSSFAISGQPGHFSMSLPAGTYDMRFVKGTLSGSFTVPINVNETTSSTFTLMGSGGGSPTFSISLSANPSSGMPPLVSNLTTTIGGTATGFIDYSGHSCGGGSISNISGGSFTCTYNSTGTYHPSITAIREGITRSSSTTITVNSYLEVVRFYDDGIVRIAGKLADSSTPLRISKNGTTFGIILVDLNDPNASHIRVNVNGSIKALRKL